MVNLYINIDFLVKQQLITLNANCQLIQCTHFTDLLSNLKGLLDSMIIKVFIVMQNVSCSQMCQNHQTFTSWSLVHNFRMCYNNYIFIYILRTLLVMNISYFLNLHYWLPLLENLGTVKLSCLKHCQRFFFHIIFILSFFIIVVAVFFSFLPCFCYWLLSFVLLFLQKSSNTCGSSTRCSLWEKTPLQFTLFKTLI